MAVDVQDKDTGCESSFIAGLERAAELVLVSIGRDASDLDVSVVGAAESERLNSEYRGKQRPTDVLSFPQSDSEEEDDFPTPDGGADVPTGHLGDVVICVDVARAQAEDGGWTLEEEGVRLLLHGILHLVGYDHELGDEEAAIMAAEESRVAEVLVGAGIGCAREVARGGD